MGEKKCYTARAVVKYYCIAPVLCASMSKIYTFLSSILLPLKVKLYIDKNRNMLSN